MTALTSRLTFSSLQYTPRATVTCPELVARNSLMKALAAWEYWPLRSSCRPVPVALPRVGGSDFNGVVAVGRPESGDLPVFGLNTIGVEDVAEPVGGVGGGLNPALSGLVSSILPAELAEFGGLDLSPLSVVVLPGAVAVVPASNVAFPERTIGQTK